MNNSTDKWPVNYKGLVSAVRPEAPILTFITPTSSSITLSWTDVSSNCIPISSYNIYQNEIIVQTKPYTIKSTTINGLASLTAYSFYITSVSNTIESLPSNIVYVNT